MAKRKSRGLKNTNQSEEYKDLMLSSGVEIRISPFPLNRYERIFTEAFEKYPEIEPPGHQSKIVRAN